VVLGEVDKMNLPFNQLKVEYITDYGGSYPLEIPVSATP